MKKNKRYSITLFIIGLVLLLCFFINKGLNEPREAEVYQISYIYRSENPTDSHLAIKQGMEQAANDLKVEISTIFLNDPHSEQEQEELLKKEVKNGADAILIEPINSKNIEQTIRNIEKKIPVIAVNSIIENHSQMLAVNCDNYELGKRMAEYILQKQNTKEKILLIKNPLDYTDINLRYLGVYETLKEKKLEVEVIDFVEQDDTMETILEKKMEEGIKKVVTFDSFSLEVLGKIKKNNPDLQYVKLYGFGKTNQIVNYVEDKVVESIGVANEYSIGYLSVQMAANQLEKKENKKSANTIRLTIVDSSNMYTTENQRLLFPFIQ